MKGIGFLGLTMIVSIQLVAQGVGINQSSPVSMLDVDGNVTIGSGASYSGSAAAPANGLLVEGVVGIGTTSPTANIKVDIESAVAGNSVINIQNTSATGYPGIEYINNSGTVSMYFGLDNANATTRLNSVNNYPIVMLTNSSERMRITSTGNVGIGTTVPSAALHMFTTDNTVVAKELMRFDNTSVHATNNGTSIGFYQGATQYGRIASHYTAAAGWFLAMGYGANDHLAINSSGNVGIGTSIPQSTLHLQGGIPRLILFDSDGVIDASNPAWSVRSQTGVFKIQTTTDYSAYTDRLEISAAGEIDVNSVKITGVATPTATTDAVNKAYVDALTGGTGPWTYVTTINSTEAFNGTVATTYTLTTGEEYLLIGVFNPNDITVDGTTDMAFIKSFSAASGGYYNYNGTTTNNRSVVDASYKAYTSAAGLYVCDQFVDNSHSGVTVPSILHLTDTKFSSTAVTIATVNLQVSCGGVICTHGWFNVKANGVVELYDNKTTEDVAVMIYSR